MSDAKADSSAELLPAPLRALRTRAREQDYLTFLDLGVPAEGGQIKAAAEAIRAQLATLQPAAGSQDPEAIATAHAVDEVRQVLDDAEAVLTDPARGPRYAAVQQGAGR